MTVRRGQRRRDLRAGAGTRSTGRSRGASDLGRVVVSIDGEPVARAPLAATRAAAAASLLERYDAAVPGSRAVAWGVAIAGLTLLFIAAIAIWDRRR